MTTQVQKETNISLSKLMELGLSFWASKTFLSAVELGVFTELGKGAASAEDLAKGLKLHLRSAVDFFDTLVALSVLDRKDGRYSNTPETDLFLDKAKPSYIGGILEMASGRVFKAWSGLTESLKNGKPQNQSAGDKGLFDVLYADQAKLKEFLSAMTGISTAAAEQIAEKFPWQNYSSFVDVGAAQGALPVRIALRHPHLKGIGYDLAVVRPIFEEYVSSFNLSERVRFEAGDFFKDALPKTDVIVMGHILHDWNLQEKQMLVKKAYEALPKGGAFVVYEALIDDDRRKNVFGLLMSLNMLIETPGGFDYTGADCSKWMKEASFTKTEVVHLVGPDSMVIGIK